jgi:hypothetical protein
VSVRNMEEDSDFNYSVNRAWAAAVNNDFDYEVEKPPARYPIGGPRRGECNDCNDCCVNRKWATAAGIVDSG